MARRNGLQLPLHPRQVATVIFSILNCVLFNAFYQRFVENEGARIFWIVITAILTTILIVSAFVLMTTNPCDPALDKRDDKKAVSPTPLNLEAGRGWCGICQAYVDPETLHCRYCDKCVIRMDHHCFYVNNCIGRRNYKLYIVVLLSAFSYYISISVAAFYVFGTTFTSNNYWRSVTSDYRPPEVKTIQAFIFLHGAMTTICVGFLLQLVYLHILLYFKKMTTLEYARLLRDESERKEATRQQQGLLERLRLKLFTGKNKRTQRLVNPEESNTPLSQLHSPAAHHNNETALEVAAVSKDIK